MSSSNIKSWADASSDEESDSEHPRIAPPPSGLPGSDSYVALQEVEEMEYSAPDGGGGGSSSVAGTNLRVMEDLPTNPPFTAYVGNLHRDVIGNSKDLWGELEKMLEDLGCTVQVDGEVVPIKIVGTRLITDRSTGQSKGFGYVEFGTPEELLVFLNLGNHQLCGRNLKVDIASGEPRSGAGGGGRGGGGGDRRRNSQARGNRGEGGGSGRYDRQYSDNSSSNFNRRDNKDDMPIDGSQFQGGRYARSNSSLSVGSGVAGSGGGSLRRNGSGMMKRTDSAASTGAAGVAVPNSPVRQRPSLKLAPRTKPLEEGNASASRSSIFGDAKPRDESKFEEKKAVAAGVVAASASVTQAIEENVVENLTASMGAMEVKKESNESKEDTIEKADASEGKEEDKTTNDKSMEKEDEFTSIPKKTLDRKTSRGAPQRGISGRGGDRTKDGEDRSNKKDGRKDSSGRRPSGRGEGQGRGGGGRGDRPRNNERGGRNNARDAGKRPSASNAKSSNGGTAKDGGTVVPTTSLAAAAALQPKKESKAPPKKINSFAAFMDESDDE
eukprot:CCRYP_003028-RA/>CCRYP_003028-RA protein AED:0.27 eAED:0.27 QI:238/1/1/1/1/1/3/156/552